MKKKEYTTYLIIGGVLLFFMALAAVIFYLQTAFENNIIAKDCLEMKDGVIKCDSINTGRPENWIDGTEFGINVREIDWQSLNSKILNQNILAKQGWLNICQGNPATRCQTECNSEIYNYWEQNGWGAFKAGQDICNSRGYDSAYYVNGECCWINVDFSDPNWYKGWYQNRDCFIDTNVGLLKGTFEHGTEPLCIITDDAYTDQMRQKMEQDTNEYGFLRILSVELDYTQVERCEEGKTEKIIEGNDIITRTCINGAWESLTTECPNGVNDDYTCKTINMKLIITIAAIIMIAGIVVGLFMYGRRKRK